MNISKWDKALGELVKELDVALARTVIDRTETLDQCSKRYAAPVLAVLKDRLEPLLAGGAEKLLAATSEAWLDAAEEFEKELSKWTR